MSTRVLEITAGVLAGIGALWLLTVALPMMISAYSPDDVAKACSYQGVVQVQDMSRMAGANAAIVVCTDGTVKGVDR